MTTLLYHSTQDGIAAVSPFDEAILKVARKGPIRIVSPYIGVTYLERIIDASPEWRLISDVQEWLGALSRPARSVAWHFIRENLDLIHHCPALHAKAVISDTLAMMGSANLTQFGILGRTEMGILIDDPKLVTEMGTWFDDLWGATTPPVVDEGSAYIQWLDEEASHGPAHRQRFVLSSGSRKVRARLAKLEIAATSSLQDEPNALALSEVAQAIIMGDQKHYDSLEAALEAAINKLLERGSFTLGALNAEIKQGFVGANRREIYMLLVQHCANHVRSVFVESTVNRLILASENFTQSARETLGPALAPFDILLVALIKKLSFTAPTSLPTEEQLEKETGFAGRDQVTLVSELLDCGFLVMDDRPGELPCYSLDVSFDDWTGRFKHFPLAHAAWVTKQYQKPAAPVFAKGVHDSPVYAPREFGVLYGDQLPEGEDDEYIDFAGLERVLRESEAQAAKRRMENSRPARLQMTNLGRVTVALDMRPRKKERPQVDNFLSRLLTTMASGRSFSAPDFGALVYSLSQATTTPEPIVKIALEPTAPHPKVFFVASRNGQYDLSINPALSWGMLLRYPKTRAVCDRLLGEA